MNNKLLIYAVEAVIIYLAFRYVLTKDRRLSVSQSLIATFTVLILSIIVERTITSYIVKKGDKTVKSESGLLEKFDATLECSTCDKQKNNNDYGQTTDVRSIESFSAINMSNNSGSSDNSSDSINIDKIWHNGPKIYDKSIDDDDKTNNLPSPSDYEHSYSFLSSESSSG